MEVNGRKQRIVVDLDDSSFDFLNPYIRFNNLKYKTNLKREDFTSYRFNEFRGGTMEEAVESVKEFCHSLAFEQVKPFPGAIEVLFKLREEYELFVGTSRPEDMIKLTHEQVSKYFPEIFSDIIFSSNHYTKAKNSGETKAEICKRLNALYIIEDSLTYSKQCIEEGTGAILLDSPWNQNRHIYGIIRLKNWEEIGNFLLKNEQH